MGSSGPCPGAEGQRAQSPPVYLSASAKALPAPGVQSTGEGMLTSQAPEAPGSQVGGGRWMYGP